MAEAATKSKSGVAKESDESIAILADSLKRYTPATLDRQTDTLETRYKIDLNSPLPMYSGKTSRAYAASDLMNRDKPLFALVCSSNCFPRQHVVAQMKLITHPHIMQLVAGGTVNLSQPEEARYVLIYARPEGKKLADALPAITTNVRGEYFLTHKIIAPLAHAIGHLAEFNIAHGLINIDNMYFTDMPILGDCIAEPCGYSQPYYYEPVERMQASPAGKGEGGNTQDYYALAVLVLNILLGTPHMSAVPIKQLIRSILREGTYNALTRNKDVPENFYDFFRGMLNPVSRERWDWMHLKPWLEGKRYNVLLSPPLSDAVRPFEIGGEESTRKRDLAQLLFEHWDEAGEHLRSGHMLHWVTVSLRDTDMAEEIDRISHSVVSGKNALQTGEQIMRTVMLLDPAGPVRFPPLSFHPDGIGTLCAELFINKGEKELQLMAKIIEYDMLNFWLELETSDTTYSVPPTISAIMLKIDKLRGCIRNTGFGFGLERMLYDLNPDMPCISPMLAGMFITSFKPLLLKLDQLAPSMVKSQDPLDRHIAAFLASKLNIQHEIRLHELEDIPALADNRSVIALRLLAVAQHRAGNLPLPGLTQWLATRIMPGLDNIKSKSLRTRVKSTLVKHAQAGYLAPISELVIYSGYSEIDHSGYNRARKLFLHNAEMIVFYHKGETIEQESAHYGVMISQIIAFFAFAATLWSVAHG